MARLLAGAPEGPLPVLRGFPGSAFDGCIEPAVQVGEGVFALSSFRRLAHFSGPSLPAARPLSGPTVRYNQLALRRRRHADRWIGPSAPRAPLGKGAADSTGSPLWDQPFRLPRRRGAGAHPRRTGRRGKKRAGPCRSRQKPAALDRHLAPAKPGAIQQTPAGYRADPKACQPEPGLDFWPVEALEPLWRSSNFMLMPGDRLAGDVRAGFRLVPPQKPALAQAAGPIGTWHPPGRYA